eukprot:COSAG03_NODE_522_length_7202_cov_16.938336_3_plen_166_part_00
MFPHLAGTAREGVHIKGDYHLKNMWNRHVDFLNLVDQVCLSLCLSLSLSLSLSLCVCVSLCVSLSLSLSLSLSVSLCLSLSLCFSLSLSVSLCLFVSEPLHHAAKRDRHCRGGDGRGRAHHRVDWLGNRPRPEGPGLSVSLSVSLCVSLCGSLCGSLCVSVSLCL